MLRIRSDREGRHESMTRQGRSFRFKLAAVVAAASALAACSRHLPTGGGYEMVGQPYVVNGVRYVPHEDPNYNQVGYASWYGAYFHGRSTANGEIYDMNRITAAHTTLPLPSYVRVTNLQNGSSIVVRVNDRGPFHDGRIIDLSAHAAELLDMQTAGIARVRVEYVGPASLDGDDDRMLMATYQAPGQPAPRIAYDPNTRTVSATTGGLFARIAQNQAPPAPTYTPTAITDGEDPLAGLLGFAGTPTLTAAQQAADAVAAGANPVVVQIGVFADMEEAYRVMQVLADFGEAMVEAVDGAAGPLFSLRISTTAALAQATIDAAAAAGVSGAHLAPG